MAKGKRGRESTGDMIRSLGLVLIIVVVLFFFAQPPSSDAQKIRVVDPTSDISAFVGVAPGVGVPRGLPAGWRATVSSYDPDTQLLRVGWVTPAGEYTEYAGALHPGGAFLTDLLAAAPQVGTLDVGGVSWREYRQGKAISLVRSYPGVTVVLGTLRDTASIGELTVLASRLGS